MWKIATDHYGIGSSSWIIWTGCCKQRARQFITESSKGVSACIMTKKSTECSLLCFQTERYHHLGDLAVLGGWKNISIDCSLDHLEAIHANTVPWL